MPPAHGAEIVRTILSAPEFTVSWRSELEEAATRIRSLRAALAGALHEWAPAAAIAGQPHRPMPEGRRV